MKDFSKLKKVKTGKTHLVYLSTYLYNQFKGASKEMGISMSELFKQGAKREVSIFNEKQKGDKT